MTVVSTHPVVCFDRISHEASRVRELGDAALDIIARLVDLLVGRNPGLPSPRTGHRRSTWVARSIFASLLTAESHQSLDARRTPAAAFRDNRPG